MMRKLIWISAIGLAACSTRPVSQLATGTWQGHLVREDGGDIVFNFDVSDSSGKKTIHIINAGERMLVDDIRQEGDSVFIRMPFFDSEFRTVLQADGSLQGQWVRHLADSDASITFKAFPNVSERFPTSADAKFNVSGRWPTYFKTPGKTDSSFAIGEFQQEGNKVQGTFLTTTGDYRFLEGVVDGDTLKLSTFDGSHAYHFSALIRNDSTLTDGVFLQGFTATRQFTAKKDSSAQLEDATTLATVKEAGAGLDFSFPDLNGQKVSIKDDRFKNKAVIVQLSGSWCPNCMDETAYLSEWYKQNKDRGVEIIMLCYERTTDFEKSKKAAEGFAKRFDVTYPVLLTGVTPSDPQKAEKTLPQLTGIKGFPTTIYVDKTGKVKEVHTGFNGPGTGVHFEEYKKEFSALMDELLK